MKCAWQELLSVLPAWMRREMEAYEESVQDIRIRLDACPEIVCTDGSHWMQQVVREGDINFIVHTASRYSPWSTQTISQGYLTASGGHRIGICGEAVMKDGVMSGIRQPTALCIRVARDFTGIAESLCGINGSILILGAPGWGKTTLLRDLIRLKSSSGKHISVVDERGELFPAGVDRGLCTEVLYGCPKAQGIERLLRTMGPEIIAVDEITAQEDCGAMTQAAWCGVELLATAHAASLSDFLHREVYHPLVKQNLFDHIVILHPDKHWHLERSNGWSTNGLVRY